MNFIDMFCGMGTIRLGFEQADCECVYSVEFDKHKRKIYEVIFGNEPEASDICAVRADDLPLADCWCFGAPCQDFSIAGKRDGLTGDKSSLVREVFRLVRETAEEYRPEWLFYENVKGMLSSNKGIDYLEILAEMDALGYNCQWQMLNSKYYGVPQNRERVYTLGHSRKYGRREIFPIGSDSGTVIKLQGQHANCLRARYEGAQGVGTYIIESEQSPQVKNINAKDNNGQEPMIQVVGKVNSSQDGIVLSPDGIAKTLTAGHFNTPKILQRGRGKNKGGSHDESPCLTLDRLEKRQNGRRFKENNEPMFTLTKQDVHGIAMGNRIRRLTPRECMRLQGVPDGITDKLIAAGISDTQLYRAAGDACTVNVIYEIAKRMNVESETHP